MELIPKAKAVVEVLHIQQKFYRWSKDGTYRLKKIFNLLYNPYVLSLAWYLVSENKGSRTPGTDGVTAKTVKEEIGVVEWLTSIEHKLREGVFKPDLVKRRWIPKSSNPAQKRPLGIPTLADRLVQMALKLVIEPIFEAEFKGCSFGFRPNRGPLHAIADVRRYMTPRNGYEWIIEADLRKCFDNIDHRLLLRQIGKKVKDKKILSLIRSFLKAGVMEQDQVIYPVSGSPQGGIISPLLANIFLDQLDEVYHQRFHTLTPDQRRTMVKHERPLLRHIRYADDFVIFVKGNKDQAIKALDDLRDFVNNTLKMELAEEKTRVLHPKEGFDFLGYQFRRGISQVNGKTGTVLLPSKEAVTRYRRKVKELTSRSNTWKQLDQVLGELNRLIRGWGEYFRYGWVSDLFSDLHRYVFMRVHRWLKKKHKGRSWKWIRRRYLRHDITGRANWNWKDTSLSILARVCPPKRLSWATENIPTPFNCDATRQALLIPFDDCMSPMVDMEKVLKRPRTGGEPGDGKLSRRVRRAAGGNGSRKGYRASC